MTTWLALLRAVNVGGRKLPMAELRALATELGLTAPQTFIQSGNLIFQSPLEASQLEELLERAITERFGFDVPVLVRSRVQWDRIVASNPFPEETEQDARFVAIALSRRPPPDGAEACIAPYAANERVVQHEDGFWMHYPDGAASTRITPTVLDRCAGCSVTARNARSAMKLAELLAAADGS